MMAQSTRNSRPAGHFWFMRLVHVSTLGLGLLLLSAPSKGFGQGDWDIGFTAGTGGATNRHLIDSLEVTGEVCD